MGRPTVWVLLGLTLLAVSLHEVQVGAEVGPSESECRPYIEKAIHNLKSSDVTDDKDESTENDVSDTGTSSENEEESHDGGEENSSEDTTVDEITNDDTHEETNEDDQSKENSESDEKHVTDDSVDESFEQADQPAVESNVSSEANDEKSEENDEDKHDESNEEHTDKSDEHHESDEDKTENVSSEDTDNKSDENKTEEQDENNSSEETTEGDQNANESGEQDTTNEDESSEKHDSTEGDESSEKKDESGEASETGDVSSEETNDDAEKDSNESVEEPIAVNESVEKLESSRLARSAASDENDSNEHDDNSKEDHHESDENKTDEDSAEAHGETEKSNEDHHDEKDDSHESHEDSKEEANDDDDVDSKEKDHADGESKESHEDNLSKEESHEDKDSKEDSHEDKDSKEESHEDKDSKEDSHEDKDSKEESHEDKDSKEDSHEDKDSKEDSHEDKDSKEESHEDKVDSKEESHENEDSKSHEGDDSKESHEDKVEKREVHQDERSNPHDDHSDEDDTDTIVDVKKGSTELEDAHPEDDLLLEYDIPTNLRDRSHIAELLHLDDESVEKENAIQKSADVILRDLKRIYENAIKPLETLYKYRDLSNRHFGDPEIFSKPLVLFMGPWSGGKSTILNYLTGNEYTPDSLRTGAEPSPAYFNILMHGDEPEVLDGTQLAADWTFSGLQKFGQGLEDRLRGLKLPSKLLEKVNIVEIPGILEVRKQVSRLFPFNDACQWFIDRADIIFLVYDPSKLDVGPETEAILDQLKGREYQTRIILNKGDQVKPEELMRVQGALIWNISPLMSSAQPPIMYTTSLWSNPYEIGAPIRLLQAQERALLRDLRNAIERRIENKIASARRFAVRVRNHAKMVDCYLTTYYNHKSLFGNKKQISDDIINHPQNYHIYEGLSTLTNISRYDLPDPEVYRDFFRLNSLYEFKKLSETCTYFRGCPINKLDIAIAYDLPELGGKYKKSVETAFQALEDESNKGKS